MKFEVTGEDLCKFAEVLIEKAQQMKMRELAMQPKEEKWLTKQSKIYINGEKQNSMFLNNTRIDLKESVLEEEDIVMAAQVGSSNTIFRTSKEYKYRDGRLVTLPRNTSTVKTGRNAFIGNDEGE